MPDISRRGARPVRPLRQSPNGGDRGIKLFIPPARYDGRTVSRASARNRPTVRPAGPSPHAGQAATRSVAQKSPFENTGELKWHFNPFLTRSDRIWLRQPGLEGSTVPCDKSVDPFSLRRRHLPGFDREPSGVAGRTPGAEPGRGEARATDLDAFDGFDV